MENLIKSLKERWTPERVINEILQTKLSLTQNQRRDLVRLSDTYSYMSSSFRQAVAKDRQLKIATELFPGVEPPASSSHADAVEYLLRLKESMSFWSDDFLAGRFDRKNREEKNLPRSHRAYNKRFRFIARLEKHLATWGRSAEMSNLEQVAKSRLASKITPEMINDLPTACFVAYMVATLNRRSIFTFGKQERAYDQVADFLLGKLGADANWLAVAYIHPSPEILARLSEEDKGRLMGEWYNVMLRSCRILETIASGIDLNSMIVRRGNDSSTWNAAAGAYNKARDGWINTLYSLGAEKLLEVLAPPKSLRLMAADVAWGHRAYGDGEDPDTKVWNDLPKPWEVLLHGEKCVRGDIELACEVNGVKGGGWIQPRSKNVANFSPTPELVHGVVVSSPELALELRKAGYFAGSNKPEVKENIPINAEFDGEKYVVSEAGQVRIEEETNSGLDSVSVSLPD